MSNSDNIAIAIDGPAASGKSTVAKRLAKALGLIMVNTGAMYRAVAWATIEQSIPVEDTEAVIKMLGEVEFSCGVEEGVSTILVNGVAPGDALRQDPVNQRVSAVAQIKEVRALLLEKQREYLNLGSIVMEGRDIGSVVFPDTPFKLYIDASVEVRAARRGAEGIVDTLADRDKKDSERKISPLVVAEGATVIDSTELSIEQVIEQTIQILKDKGAPEALFSNS